MPRASNDPRRELGRVIGERRVDIERRWLEKVSEEVAARKDLELTHLRDGMPDYIAELARLLSGHKGKKNGEDSWSRVAADHGITRVRVGFDLHQLVREFITLRKVIEEVASEAHALATSACSALSDLIEAAITRSVCAYVETRDYELRRRQAENIAFLIHELRNPLMAAGGAASLVREAAVPAQAKALDMLDRSHQRLTELIDGVLLTERLEAGHATPRWADITLGELLDKSTAAARKVAADKGIELDIHADRERAIRIDPELTRSALQNLVDNAVKYTDMGRIDLVVEDHGADIAIHVRDSCPGISPEELRTIFEPFRRGSTTKKGSGLGLAIARRAIEAQGGSMHAESGEPTGCHFWFTLPKH